MKLYSYWQSSTSYRVRIALNLKGCDYSLHPVNLAKGEHSSPQYLALNPGQGVPTLEWDDGTVLTQSLAILDWLDTAAPNPPFLTGNAVDQAHQRAAALVIAADIHPVNNLKVLESGRKLFQ